MEHGKNKNARALRAVDVGKQQKTTGIEAIVTGLRKVVRRVRAALCVWGQSPGRVKGGDGRCVLEQAASVNTRLYRIY